MDNHNEQITQSDHADQLSVVVDDAGGVAWQICSGGICLRNRCGARLLEEYRALLVSQGRPVP